MNLRRLMGIIREAEREAQNPQRQLSSRLSYIGLSHAARRVLAEEFLDGREHHVTFMKRKEHEVLHG